MKQSPRTLLEDTPRLMEVEDQEFDVGENEEGEHRWTTLDRKIIA